MNSKDIGIVMVFGIAGVVAIALFMRPLIRAWARRISGEAASPAQSEEIAELQSRVAELEVDRGHLHELEERLDFAERMLAQRNDPVRLPNQSGMP